MTSAGYNLYLQQGAGNYEGIEESDLSQQSEDSCSIDDCLWHNPFLTMKTRPALKLCCFCSH